MRIVNLMTLVCLLIVLAVVPACAQFANACGLPTSTTLTTVVVVLLLAGSLAQRT